MSGAASIPVDTATTAPVAGSTVTVFGVLDSNAGISDPVPAFASPAPTSPNRTIVDATAASRGNKPRIFLRITTPLPQVNCSQSPLDPNAPATRAALCHIFGGILSSTPSSTHSAHQVSFKHEGDMSLVAG